MYRLRKKINSLNKYYKAKGMYNRAMEIKKEV